MQPQMERRLMSRSAERAGEDNSTDGCQGDGGGENQGGISKQLKEDGTRSLAGTEDKDTETTEHAECRLQVEAQHISLTQIHAAQLELLQEGAEGLRSHTGQDEPMRIKFNSIGQVVTEECNQIIQGFKKVFGEEFFQSVDPEGRPSLPVDWAETVESSTAVLKARDLYTDMQQLRETIVQEHVRLSALQSLLRADGNKMTELQTAYDELKSHSERTISDLRVQVSLTDPSPHTDEQSSAPTTSIMEELRRLRAQDQQKQLWLEERHRQEVERLRAHYQQEAAETEERYLTELCMLQQRLQDVTGAHTHFSVSESHYQKVDEQQGKLLKEPSEEELSAGGAESPARSAGLTAQLQALRRALYHKYLQEVAALKEQHDRELRRLRDESGQKQGGEEQPKEQDPAGGLDAGRCVRRGSDGRWPDSERTPDRERVEEEVARAVVQMSVQFAQQTELARLNKRARQRCTSMQTQSEEGGEEERAERDSGEPTPRASPTTRSWPESVERERLQTELDHRAAEIKTLKEELERSMLAPKQTFKKQQRSKEEAEDEEEQGGKRKIWSPPSPLDGIERNSLLTSNQNLRQALAEVLKTTAAAEETLGLHMQSLASSGEDDQRASWEQTSVEPLRSHPAGGSESSPEGATLWSDETRADQELNVSWQMIESWLLGSETQPENEDYLTGISGRLQAALEKMLMAITDTTNQLEHAKMTQTELMRESFRHNQEINELLQKQEELQERLAEEARAREQLALELHRAEGLIDGYTGERAALEEQLRQKDELQLSLEQDLQVTSSRLQELEQERLQMQEERELLSRQQDAMREDAGPRELRLVEAAMVAAPEADLLEETEKLMKEKVEVQRQAEKENADLLKHAKLLETELEEHVNRAIELEQAHRLERGDLQQQVQALEKQLEKNRKFLDEQAVDREHERDFFQQEIHKLEQQLKNPQKLQTASEQRNREVEQLTSQLKEKADWCSELLLSTEQRCRELQERDEEIDKLESRVRELEQALLASAESLEKVEQKKQHASVTENKQPTLESQLQTEREALERKEKEICNLEEQLEQFKEELENKSEEVQQLHMQLEIQKKEIISQQDYMETRDSLLQVMEAKDREIALLNEQITRLQHMETTTDNKEIDVRNELIKDLESQVECLRSEQERLRKNNEEELEQLNSVIDKLQQDLANIEQKHIAEEDKDSRLDSESSSVCGPSQDEYKERAEAVAKELDVVKAKHEKLLETHRSLIESSEASAESTRERRSEAQLEEALRQKTAGLVVMQAQVQALEQSATSRVEELDLRIRELEDALEEKEGELGRCRLLVEQRQSHTESLERKVSNLEKNLREKVAAVLVSQATLEAFQQQQQQQQPQTSTDQQVASTEPHSQLHTYDFGDFGIPKMDLVDVSQARHTPPTGKVFHLTQRLRELEVGLSGMQKDQELQKHLLSSSEEEVLEYERTLTVLMDLLNQMKSATADRTSSADKASFAEEQPAASELIRELQEVRDEVSSTKEQLDSYKDSCSQLQDELKEKTVSIQRLQEQLHKGTSGGTEEADTFQLKEQLTQAQNEASATKEELSSCKESLEKLQQLMQEREMTIAHLKEELFKVKAGEDRADVGGLLQEARDDVASTKEELDGYKQRSEKLESDLLFSKSSISKLQEQLLEMKQSGDSAREELNSSLQHTEKLQEDVHGRDRTISELREELQSTRQSLEDAKLELRDSVQCTERLQEDVGAHKMMVAKVQEELEDMRQTMDAGREELNCCKQQNEKLKEELHTREISASKLKEELQEVRKASLKPAESGSPSPSPSPSPGTSPQPPAQPASAAAQPKRKGGKQAAAKGGSGTKDKPSLSRKAAASSSSTSSSGRSHGSRPGGSSSEAGLAHACTQTEHEHTPTRSPADESQGGGGDDDGMEEVIGEFQQKIAQMRELHAAEILDMEARHISESEALRRDTQALEEECKALKAVVDKLRSSEVHSLRQDRLASQFRDGYTSDSSSDFSQRTSLDIPGLQQELRATPEGARRETDDALPDKIKSLLREVHQEGMQVLSLSELPLSEGEPGGQTNFQGWARERGDLLATVESLKHLVTQMQTQREPQTSGSEDWRAELLEAVRHVFLRERSLLKSALYSQLDLLDTNDAIVHLNQLESRLAEQDAQHQEAMGMLHAADRSSLVSEIRQLRSQLLHTSEAQLTEWKEGGGRAVEAAAAAAAAAALAAPPAAAGPSDRLLVEELKVELSQTKLELETTLKAQHKHLKELDTLRAEVSQKAAETDELNDQLAEERKRSRDLQWAVEKEKCRTGRDEERRREELEDLQLSLEEQQSRVAQLSLTLEQERQASSQLSDRAEQERLALHRHLQELQVQLETKEAKNLEVSAALGREKERRAGKLPQESRPSGAQEKEEEGRMKEEEESLLERLQRELDHKHAQVVDLLSQVEAQRLEVVRKEEALTLGSQRMRREQEALQEARAQLEGLNVQLSGVQEQLEKEAENVKALEEEKERMEERISQLAGAGGGGGAGGKEIDAATAAWHAHSTDRTKDWVIQQEIASHPHIPATGGLQHHGPWRTLDRILGKLHLISSKVRSMAGKAAGRPTTEADAEELSWVQASVEEVIALLQQSPALPSIPESVSLLAGSSSNTLTERLLRQNAELTGFVSRLTEEKNDLRNHTLRLEEEVRRYRQTAPGAGDSVSGSSRWGAVSKADVSGLMFSQEREAWTREKTRLEKALHQAQAQVARLRGEIRAETVREVTGPEADNAALKRMYSKYLRSESFRKALVYQKKYLLLLLGGFQECEEATLSLLSRMGGAPSPASTESLGQRRRGLTRFRSAVRVSIALSRMRFLVKRWHKATGLSSTASCIIGKNGTGQSLGPEARDSPYLHPGSAEVYRERGGGASGSRGRSGRESPRSAVSSSHHRFHGAGDHGALTCSHLQSYDPDRALTDYISRLEALQRRLGSVTSGASSYAQLHFGLRR